MICLYASGNYEVDYITSADSGVTWSAPQYAFPIDDFSVYDNFDTNIDRSGIVHCVHRYNGSGCYSVFAKTGSATWAPSGTLARGFCDGRTSVAAKDFNGTVEVFDNALGFSQPGANFAARIAAVDSSNTVKLWYVNPPYTAFPTLDGAIDPVNVGSSGGYPIVTDAGWFGALGIPFSVDGTGLLMAEDWLGTFRRLDRDRNWIDIDPWVSDLNIVKQSGYIGKIPFNSNMAWLRTHFYVATYPYEDASYPILVSDVSGNFEMYTTSNEVWGEGPDFTIANSNEVTAAVGTYKRINTDDYTFNELAVPIAGGRSHWSSGTPVGLSFFNEENTIHMYFQNRRLDGGQTIFRIKSYMQLPETATSDYSLRYNFSNLTDPVSGIISWADTSLSTAGAGASGQSGIVHWHGFKPIQNSIGIGSGTPRTEIVATIGSGVTSGVFDNVSKLYMYRFEDSIAAGDTGPIPTYVSNLIRSPAFSGIASANNPTAWANVTDDDGSTYGTFGDHAYAVFVFNEPQVFSRLEIIKIAGYAFSFPAIYISGSMDGVNYYPVKTIPQGISTTSAKNLIKISSELDFPYDETIDATMDQFAAKYIRMAYRHTPDFYTWDISEVKWYGDSSTAGFISTSGLSETFYPYRGLGKIETFGGTAQDSLPSNFATTGDFSWFVDRGTHESGFFLGNTIGSGNDAAVRVQRNSPINSSGILSVPLTMTGSSRTLRFDVKWDFSANVGAVSEFEPTDDYFFVELVTPTGTVSLTEQVYTGVYVSPNDYRRITYTSEETGDHTLRFIYRRGSTPVGSGGVAGEGTVWLDNITVTPGEDAGNPLTILYGYTEGAALPSSGEFYGYASGIGGFDENINAYMGGSGNTPSGEIYAFLKSDTQESGMFYGYLASARDYESVYGYMSATIDTASGTVYAYMFTSGAADSFYGFMKNPVNESVYGFLKAPSGAYDTIYAYVTTPQFVSVNGYMAGPTPHSGSIAGYLQSKDFDEHIYAFISGAALSHEVYGYMNSPGIVGTIYAYMPNGEKTTVYGYIEGADVASGVINAWTSGIGISSGIVNAYTFGVSGIPTGIVYGFVEAVNVPNGQLQAFVIGFDSGESCNLPVPNPSSVTIPTGNFFT